MATGKRSGARAARKQPSAPAAHRRRTRSPAPRLKDGPLVDLAYETLLRLDALFDAGPGDEDATRARQVAREAILALAGAPSPFDDKIDLLIGVRRAAREMQRPELYEACRITEHYARELRSTGTEGERRQRARAFLLELRGLSLPEFNEPAIDHVLNVVCPTEKKPGRPAAPQGLLASILGQGPKFADAVRDEVRKHLARDPG